MGGVSLKSLTLKCHYHDLSLITEHHGITTDACLKYLDLFRRQIEMKSQYNRRLGNITLWLTPSRLPQANQIWTINSLNNRTNAHCRFINKMQKLGNKRRRFSWIGQTDRNSLGVPLFETEMTIHNENGVRRRIIRKGKTEKYFWQ